MQQSSDSSSTSLILMPSQIDTNSSSQVLGSLERKTVPEPSPLPTLAKDSQLSTVSFIDNSLLPHELCVVSEDDNSTHEITIFPEKQTDSHHSIQQDQHQQLQLQVVNSNKDFCVMFL